MRRIRLRDTPSPRVIQDTILARENARLRQGMADIERELAQCEKGEWAGGRSALEPRMKNALAISRACLDR